MRLVSLYFHKHARNEWNVRGAWLTVSQDSGHFSLFSSTCTSLSWMEGQIVHFAAMVDYYPYGTST
jgi:hypothetical protein